MYQISVLTIVQKISSLYQDEIMQLFISNEKEG